MTDTSDLERFKALNEKEWTDSDVIAGFDKWHSKYSKFISPVTQEMLRLGEIASGMNVLDLACGSGDPAITIADKVGDEGLVTAIDFGSDMLAVAERKAKDTGVRNLELQTADAHALPFAEATFDRVTCRFGVMYFADDLQALLEARRVLRTEGRAVFVAHATPEQPLMASTFGVLGRYVDIPQPEPNSPNGFRYTPEGSLEAVMKQAGFSNAREERITSSLTWPGPPDELCQWFSEIAPPMREGLAQLSETQRAEALGAMRESFARFVEGDSVTIPFPFVLALGDK